MKKPTLSGHNLIAKNPQNARIASCPMKYHDRENLCAVGSLLD